MSNRWLAIVVIVFILGLPILLYFMVKETFDLDLIKFIGETILRAK